MMSVEGRFRVAVGVDGSRLSLLALEWAITEGRLRRATLHVLTAWEFPIVVAGMPGVLDTTNLEAAARHAQTMALERIAHDDVDVIGDVLHGPAAKILIDASKRADLVVVGARGHGGFTGLLLGSVSAQVVHHATCSVMVVRD